MAAHLAPPGGVQAEGEPDVRAMSNEAIMKRLMMIHQEGRERAQQSQFAKAFLMDELLKTCAEQQQQPGPADPHPEADVVERLLLHHWAGRTAEAETQFQLSLLIDELVGLTQDAPRPRITREVLTRIEEGVQQTAPIEEVSVQPVNLQRTYTFGEDTEGDEGEALSGLLAEETTSTDVPTQGSDGGHDEDTLIELPPAAVSPKVPRRRAARFTPHTHMHGGKPCESCLLIQRREKERLRQLDKLRSHILLRTAVTKLHGEPSSRRSQSSYYDPYDPYSAASGGRSSSGSVRSRRATSPKPYKVPPQVIAQSRKGGGRLRTTSQHRSPRSLGAWMGNTV